MALLTQITEFGIALLEPNPISQNSSNMCSPDPPFLAAPSQPLELRLVPTGAFSFRLEFTPAPHVYPNPPPTSFVAYYCVVREAPDQRQPQQTAAGGGAANLCDGGTQASKQLKVALADIEIGIRTSYPCNYSLQLSNIALLAFTLTHSLNRMSVL